MLDKLSPSQKRMAVAVLIGGGLALLVLVRRGGSTETTTGAGSLTTGGPAGAATFADNGQALGALGTNVTDLIGQQQQTNANLGETNSALAAFMAQYNADRAADKANLVREDPQPTPAYQPEPAAATIAAAAPLYGSERYQLPATPAIAARPKKVTTPLRKAAPKAAPKKPAAKPAAKKPVLVQKMVGPQTRGGTSAFLAATKKPAAKAATPKASPARSPIKSQKNAPAKKPTAKKPTPTKKKK